MRHVASAAPYSYCASKLSIQPLPFARYMQIRFLKTSQIYLDMEIICVQIMILWDEMQEQPFHIASGWERGVVRDNGLGAPAM